MAFEYLCSILNENNGLVMLMKLLAKWFPNMANQKGTNVNANGLTNVAYLKARNIDHSKRYLLNY
jgi:hypothetical protein